MDLLFSENAQLHFTTRDRRISAKIYKSPGALDQNRGHELKM